MPKKENDTDKKGALPRSTQKEIHEAARHPAGGVDRLQNTALGGELVEELYGLPRSILGGLLVS